jgi:hypothetical protein
MTRAVEVPVEKWGLLGADDIYVVIDAIEDASAEEDFFVTRDQRHDALVDIWHLGGEGPLGKRVLSLLVAAAAGHDLHAIPKVEDILAAAAEVPDAG